MAKSPRGLFVPLDVNYPRDPKIRRAGPDAELLYIRGLAHAKVAKTDGVIYDFDLDVVAVGLTKVGARVRALVTAQLWEPIDGGWLIRGWANWNPLVAELEDVKARQRAAAARTTHEVHHVAKGKTSPSCDYCLKAVS